MCNLSHEPSMYWPTSKPPGLQPHIQAAISENEELRGWVMLHETLRPETHDEDCLTRVAKFRKEMGFVALYDAEAERECAEVRRRSKIVPPIIAFVRVLH